MIIKNKSQRDFKLEQMLSQEVINLVSLTFRSFLSQSILLTVAFRIQIRSLFISQNVQILIYLYSPFNSLTQSDLKDILTKKKQFTPLLLRMKDSYQTSMMKEIFRVLQYYLIMSRQIWEFYKLLKIFNCFKVYAVKKIFCFLKVKQVSMYI